MSCLHVCPSCERHVRSTETTCPFCDVALPEDFGVCGPPRANGRPLTRAAFLLMSATALTACGKSPGGGGAEIYGPPPVDARDAGQAQPPVAVYGPAPVLDTPLVDAGVDSGPKKK